MTNDTRTVRDYDEIEAELMKPVVTYAPHKDSDHPRSLVCRVADRYTKLSDYPDSEGRLPSYPVLVVEDERSDTVWVVYGSPGMLKGKIERLDPRIGDLIGIAYVGRADENDEKSAQRWNLKVIERAAGTRADDEQPATSLDDPQGGDDDESIPF